MGEEAARWLGIDTMPSIVARLRDVPGSDAVWYTAVGIADEAQWQQLLDVAAERVLRHDDAPDEPAPWWTSIVQAMERFPGTGGPLFCLALESPIPDHKALGLRGLQNLAVDAWPAGADAHVDRVARSDPDRERRRWAMKVLAARRD